MSWRLQHLLQFSGPLGLFGGALLAGGLFLVFLSLGVRAGRDPAPPVHAQVPSTAPSVSDALPHQGFTIQRQEAGAAGVAPGGAEIVFIVRLRNAPEVTTITRNFKRDPDAARAAWDQLCRRIPAFAEFDLAGASYAGEIRVSRSLPEVSEKVIGELQSRLLDVEGVVYADPDYIAHPGEKDRP